MGGNPGADLGLRLRGEGSNEDGAAGVILGDLLNGLDVAGDGVGGFAIEGEIHEGSPGGGVVDFPEFFEFAIDVGDGDFLAKEGSGDIREHGCGN